MNKWQAQYQFWASFGVSAYDAASVPTGDDAPSFPYITYEGTDAPFDGDMPVNVSIWTRSTAWTQADALSDAIFAALKNGGKVVNYDGGMIWITAATPFSQNMGDPDDDLIRRKLLGVTLHFA